MAKQNSKKRLDQLLLDKGEAGDLKEAQGLILAGKVIVNDQRVDKVGFQVKDDAVIRVRHPSPYVSRGGEKLAGAMEDFQTTPLLSGKTVLDVGASTGGFTDFCLKSGASRVIALDVGTNQLAYELRVDPRVIVIEQTDIRSFVPDQHPPIHIVVGDLSFISLETVASAIVTAGGDSVTDFFLLVKPQFELESSRIPEGGVVTADTDRNKAMQAVVACFQQNGLVLEDSADSKLPGATGNREIFVWLKKRKPIK